MGSLEDKTIYAIRHNITKRIYVGCSVHYEKRIREHISHLRNGNHTNVELQKDYDIYGESYSFFLIETGVRFYDCFDREKMWMCVLKSNDIKTGYNLMKQERAYDIEDFKKVDIVVGKKKTILKALDMKVSDLLDEGGES